MDLVVRNKLRPRLREGDFVVVFFVASVDPAGYIQAMRILAICGSLQANSSNMKLLRRASELARADVEFVLYDRLRDLPHFDPDLENADQLRAVDDLRSAIAASDALLIACPEYGFSLPGSLKNAIDWLIGTGELEKKVIGVTASTNHPDRGTEGLRALLQTLSAVSARVVGGKPTVRGQDEDAQVDALLSAIESQVKETPKFEFAEP